MVRALQLVCVIDTDTVTTTQRLSFFNETRHSYGRSALMFSGGATMGICCFVEVLFCLLFVDVCFHYWSLALKTTNLTCIIVICFYYFNSNL